MTADLAVGDRGENVLQTDLNNVFDVYEHFLFLFILKQRIVYYVYNEPQCSTLQATSISSIYGILTLLLGRENTLHLFITTLENTVLFLMI